MENTSVAFSTDVRGKEVFYSNVSPAQIFSTATMKRIDVNTFQTPVLVDACYHGDMPVVEKQILMTYSFSNSRFDTQALNQQAHGATPLMAAIQGNHPDVIDRLLKAGACVETANGSCHSFPVYDTALLFAVRFRQWSALELMLPYVRRKWSIAELVPGLDIGVGGPASTKTLLMTRWEELTDTEDKKILEDLQCKRPRK